MELNDFIQLIIGTGFIATLISHFLNTYNNNISQERIKWREHIRKVSQEIVSFPYHTNPQETDNTSNQTKVSPYKLYCELSNRLNPKDSYDKRILKEAYKILFYKQNKKRNFINMITSLLKYDWERCKFESSLVSLVPFTRFISMNEYLANNSQNKVCKKWSIENKFRFKIQLKEVLTIIIFLIGLCYFLLTEKEEKNNDNSLYLMNYILNENNNIPNHLLQPKNELQDNQKLPKKEEVNNKIRSQRESSNKSNKCNK